MTIKDMPDNYPWMPNDARYPMGDVGEMAVRLGSPVIFDRRGSVIWMEDFRSGVGSLTVGSSGTGGFAKITADNAFRGGYDLLLSAGSTVVKNAYFWKYFTHTNIEKIGVEYGVAFIDAFSYIDFSIVRYTGSIAYTARIKLDYADDKIQYYDSAGAWQDIDVLDPFLSGDKAFNLVKLVVDFDAVEYVRLMYNNHIYSLAGIAFQSAASASDQQTFIDFTVFGTGAAAQEVQVSHVIITAGEN